MATDTSWLRSKGMRKLLTGTALAMLMAVSPAYASGIPVVDAALNSQAAKDAIVQGKILYEGAQTTLNTFNTWAAAAQNIADLPVDTLNRVMGLKYRLDGLVMQAEAIGGPNGSMFERLSRLQSLSRTAGNYPGGVGYTAEAIYKDWDDQAEDTKRLIGIDQEVAGLQAEVLDVAAEMSATAPGNLGVERANGQLMAALAREQQTTNTLLREQRMRELTKEAEQRAEIRADREALERNMSNLHDTAESWRGQRYDRKLTEWGN